VKCYASIAFGGTGLFDTGTDGKVTSPLPCRHGPHFGLFCASV